MTEIYIQCLNVLKVLLSFYKCMCQQTLKKKLKYILYINTCQGGFVSVWFVGVFVITDYRKSTGPNFSET